MNSRLALIGNVPVSNSVLASFYPEISNKNKKLGELESSGVLVRLKRGTYVVSPDITGKPLSTELIANHLRTPSYVSMFTALRYYGLTPERVYVIQSMTTLNSRRFDTPIGTFTYTRVSRDVFPIGVTRIVNGTLAFLIATPEKALCDLVTQTAGLNLRYIGETADYLFDDLRLDTDGAKDFDLELMHEIATLSKKQTTITTIIKVLERL